MAQSPGALSISPTHVVIDERARSAEVLLVNRGDEDAIYRVFLKDLRMKPDGHYEPIEQSREGEHSAMDMLRFSPRQVHLPPRGMQRIRVLVRRPADLADGEYRSHLHVQQVPSANPATDVEAPTDSGQIAIRMVPLFGASIPIIVREGPVSATASLSDVALEHVSTPVETSAVALRLHRAGSSSIRGDLEVRTARPDGAEGELLGIAKGISVLAPTSERQVRVRLNAPIPRTSEGDAIQVRYVAREDKNATVLAEAVVLGSTGQR